jgi:hypothetical protein
MLRIFEPYPALTAGGPLECRGRRTVRLRNIGCNAVDEIDAQEFEARRARTLERPSEA